MSIYKDFKTSEKLETEGIELDYGSCKVTVCRAGGSNKEYAKVLKNLSKPYERAIRLGALDAEVDVNIMVKVYAKTVIKDWQTLVDGKYKRGIEAPDGKIIAFNEENVANTLKLLPELYLDIAKQVNNMELFKESILEAEAKN